MGRNVAIEKNNRKVAYLPQILYTTERSALLNTQRVAAGYLLKTFKDKGKRCVKLLIFKKEPKE
jgi:hypothetical protein